MRLMGIGPPPFVQYSETMGFPSQLKLPIAVLAAIVVAEGAVWLLRPDRTLEPLDAPESAYFTEAQLDRAHDYASDRRLIALLGLACEGGALVLLVVRPPRRAVRAIERATGGRRLAAGALAGAALALVVQAAGLPAAALAHDRAVDVGLSTQSWGEWAVDTVKSGGIGLVFAGAGAALFLWVIGRFPRRWWIGATAITVAITVVFVWLAPVVLAPLFNNYEKLPAGPARSDVIELAQRAGIDVGQVYEVDASRRTTAANAYVTGIGHTKRVVLYDTLLHRFTPEQTRLVVAHELGHVKHDDLWRGILWVLVAAPVGMYVVQLLTERWSRKADAPPGTAAMLPALALAIALVSFGGTVISNQLSRRVEASADAFSLDIAGHPRQFIGLERRLAINNVSDPSPPGWAQWLFGTHPTTMQRIGMGLAFERRGR
jgi:STE24 endopeptidase